MLGFQGHTFLRINTIRFFLSYIPCGTFVVMIYKKVTSDLPYQFVYVLQNSSVF